MDDGQMQVLSMFGLPFRASTLDESARGIINAAVARRKALVVTPNVDHVVMLHRDREMRAIYESAEFLFADGMPLVWLSKLLPGPALPERVTGADLLVRICELAPSSGLRLFFLGGLRGVARQAAVRLMGRIPGLNVVGTYCPPFGFETDEEETERIIKQCNARRPDLLFVGVGAPKQEKWSVRNMARLDVGPIICCGASFDFPAGIISRAPVLLQRSGLEWLWRLFQEPRRLWKRYLLRDPAFVRHPAR